MAKIDLGRVVGYSAYEIAVQQGYVGTEAEWIASLKGKDGKDGSISFDELTPEQKEQLRGPQGIQGPEGPVGPKGEDAVLPSFKTINHESIIGEGDIEISGGAGIAKVNEDGSMSAAGLFALEPGVYDVVNYVAVPTMYRDPDDPAGGNVTVSVGGLVKVESGLVYAYNSSLSLSDNGDGTYYPSYTIYFGEGLVAEQSEDYPWLDVRMDMGLLEDKVNWEQLEWKLQDFEEGAGGGSEVDSFFAEDFSGVGGVYNFGESLSRLAEVIRTVSGDDWINIHMEATNSGFWAEGINLYNFNDSMILNLQYSGEGNMEINFNTGVITCDARMQELLGDIFRVEMHIMEAGEGGSNRIIRQDEFYGAGFVDEGRVREIVSDMIGEIGNAEEGVF